MTDLTGTITFPPGQWIPNVDQVTSSAATLLAIAGKVLDSYGLGDPYERRVFLHGAESRWNVTDPPQSQLIVRLEKMHFGKAGQEQYQFEDGMMGKYAQRVIVYQVEVVNPWPQFQGNIAVAPPDGDALEFAAQGLWRDGLIVWSALAATSLGGVKVNPPVGPIAQDKILVGPMTPVGPSGPLAGLSTEVRVAF